MALAEQLADRELAKHTHRLALAIDCPQCGGKAGDWCRLTPGATRAICGVRTIAGRQIGELRTALKEALSQWEDFIKSNESPDAYPEDEERIAELRKLLP